VLVGALAARELGALRREQTLAAVMSGFGPRCSRPTCSSSRWPLLGVAVGIGMETKYTITVVLVLLIATFLVWRHDVLRTRRLPLALAIATVLPSESRLGGGTRLERATGSSTRPPSGSDETRPVFIANVILLMGAAVPVAVAGVMSLVRDRRCAVRLDDSRHGRRLLRPRRQVREQDQWSCVGGLCREGEVQQNEGIRIPAKADRHGVRRDPTDHDHGLSGYVLWRPEEASGSSALRPKASSAKALGKRRTNRGSGSPSRSCVATARADPQLRFSGRGFSGAVRQLSAPRGHAR
jgi:Dolichyl-phosphate-mannose-protein mannosyltransferase